MTIRLMIVDDHDLIRVALVQYFATQPGIEVVAEAACGKELLHELRTIPVDLLLLDISMPGLSGVDLIPLLKIYFPAMRILMLSADDHVPMVLKAMRAGANGYLCKTCSPETLLEAVKEVMVTGKYLSQCMAEQVAYAAAQPQPENNEITDHNGMIRLNGKSIHEWKIDCETFYQEKSEQEKINSELNSENIALENSAFDLKEKIRHIEQPESAAGEPGK